MSYILDALRKADSERERGAVPTLHSHSAHATQGSHSATYAGALSGWRRGAVFAAGALLVGLLLVLLLWLGGWLSSEPKSEPVMAADAAGATAQPAQLPPPAQAAASVGTSALAPLTPTLLAPPPAPESVAETKPTGPTAAAASASAPTPAVAAAAAPAPAPVPKLTDLPEAVRKALPALVTSGAMYSDTPANRMLIVNGQLLREGDKIAPELLLERIELKSAVLMFKGQRFRISY